MADAISSTGKLVNLAPWWTKLNQKYGPEIGYLPEASKTWLLVKPEHEAEGNERFFDVNISTEGRPFLGSFIGNHEGTLNFVRQKVIGFVKDIYKLTEVALINPQNAYILYINGISQRWQYLSRTTPEISEELKPLERAIRTMFLPALFGGRYINDQLRNIIALPIR